MPLRVRGSAEPRPASITYSATIEDISTNNIDDWQGTVTWTNPAAGVVQKQISLNDGATWTTFETTGFVASGEGIDINPQDFVDPDNNYWIRAVVTDLPGLDLTTPKFGPYQWS